MRIVQQNVMEYIKKSALQLALVVVSVLAATFGLSNVFISLKDPIIIERGCDTKLADLASSSQSKDEIENFVKLALAVRFDTLIKADPALVLTENLQTVRSKEQAELKTKGIDQRVIVRTIKFDQDKYLVEADRLIGFGKVRTAIPIQLVVTLASKVRSISNPYGLILTSVDLVKEDTNGK